MGCKLCESVFGGQSKSLFQESIYGLWIGFATRLFHHLTNEPGGEFWFAFHLFGLSWIGGDDTIDRLFDRVLIGELSQSALGDDCTRIAAVAPKDIEQVLG